MLYACRCLNFILDTSGDGEPVASSIVEVLSRRAQGLKLILVNFEAITIKIDVLVGLTRLTSWREFHCSYCDVWVYAHPSSEIPSPASKVIVNKSILVTHRDIKISKEDERFSPVFKIIRLHDNGDDMFSGSRSVPSWDDSLHPVASSWLEEQTQAVKARIRKFSDQQYAELERDRLRAQSEQLSIFRMVGINKSGGETVEEAPRPHSSIGQPTSTEPSSSTSGGYNEPEPVNMPPLDVLESDDLILLEASYSSHHGSLESEESDEEVIEAPEQPDPDQLGPNQLDPDQQEPDQLDPDQPAGSVARSLPIPVPQFLEDHGHDDRHERSPRTPSDIAANIQALARSVHGNPIFGELPRPRFTKD